MPIVGQACQHLAPELHSSVVSELRLSSQMGMFKRSLLASPDDLMGVVVLISPADDRSSMPTWLLLGTLKMHRGAVLLFSSSERGKMYAH